jgi:molecular chaperone GrpE
VTEQEQPLQMQMDEQQGKESVQEELGSESAESTDGYGQLLREHEELRDKYMRIYADFDNFRKRVLKEKADLIRTAAQDTLSALLPVLDDFDRAKANSEKEGSSEVMTEGIQLVYNKLFSTLRNMGLEAMETHHQPFDPEFHEAITEVPVPDEALKGKIVDTVEKGYKLGDKIIRYAKVVVGK